MAPIMKIGPEVVQKIDIRFASSSVIKSFEYRSWIIFAPIGYPDKMLIKKQYRDTPGVPNSFCDTPENLFEILKTVPSSVNSFVRNIKGNRPGNTEKKNNFNPFIVAVEKTNGFEIIKSITKNTIAEKVKFKKFPFKLKIKNFCFFREIVFVIIKYMLKWL